MPSSPAGTGGGTGYGWIIVVGLVVVALAVTYLARRSGGKHS